MELNHPESNSMVLKNLQAFLSGKNSNNSNSTNGGGRRSNGTGRSPIRSRQASTTSPPNNVSMEEGKRNRSANYSSLEKELFLTAVEPYKHILEDKRFDSETLLRKSGAWKDIVIIFNSHHCVVRRDRKQLKELWKRLKDRARKSNPPAVGPSSARGSGGMTNGTSRIPMSSKAPAPRVINITTLSNGNIVPKAPGSSRFPNDLDHDESEQILQQSWSQYPSLHALALASAAQNPLDVSIKREAKSSFGDELEDCSSSFSPNLQQIPQIIFNSGKRNYLILSNHNLNVHKAMIHPYV